MKSSPSDFLKQVIGRPVEVKINTGEIYKGILSNLDGFMNIVLEQTKEYTSKEANGEPTSYGDCFIRGNNVLYIAQQQ